MVFCVDTTAQSLVDLPRLQVANVTAYGVDHGLPVSCTFDGVLDDNGRMWVNACYGIDEHRSVDFFEFDGKAVITAPGNDLIGETNGQSYIAGKLDDGRLYGGIRGANEYFYFDPVTLESSYYKLVPDEAVIIQIDQTEEGKLIILTTTSNEWIIFRCDGQDQIEIGRVPKLHGRHQGQTWYFDQSQVLDGSILWFYDYALKKNFAETDVLVKFDINTGQWRRYTLSDIAGTDSIEPFLTMFRNIEVNSNGEVFLFVGGLHSHFLYDEKTDSFEPLKLFPTWNAPETNISYYSALILADESGNTLFTYRNEQLDIVGYLRDANGKFYDYSEVLQVIGDEVAAATPIVKNISSVDLREGGIAFLDGGIAAYELQFNQSVNILLEQVATRAICEVDEEHLAVIREVGYGKNLLVYEPWKEPSTSSRIELASTYLFTDLKKAPDGSLWYRQEFQQSIGRYKLDGALEDVEIPVEVQRFEFLDDRTAILVSSDAVYRYDIIAGTYQRLTRAGDFDGNRVYQVISPDGKVIYIGSLNGLWKVDAVSGECQRISQNCADERIMCINFDSRGRLWAGTFSAGIFIFDPDAEEEIQIDESRGLSNNTVVGILTDSEGYNWVSTFNGLNVLSPEGEILARLYESDGLSTNEFNRGSFVKGAGGRMYFGSINGINVISPEELKPQILASDSVRIVINRLYKSDQQGRTRDYVWSELKFNNTIELPADDRSLSIEFGLSNYIRPADHHYEYRLDGINSPGNQSWNSLGNNRRLSLAGLPSGKYQLRVRGSDHRGTPSFNELVIPIHAKAFFYQQVWFYVLIALMILVGALLWFWRERNKRRELEVIVAQRTQRIRKDKELIERQANDLKALDEIKSRFFTNISHEFRTPLTVIEGMARKAEENPERWAKTSVHTVRRNASRLLDLVNQILDLRKLEAGKLEPSMVNGDVIALLGYIANSFHQLSEANELEMHVDLAPNELEMDHDREMWQRIISNLLSNAIKYNTRGGKVFLSSSVDSTDSNFIIEVSDTGIGIPVSDQEHIFDLFYQAGTSKGHQSPGTGVGLAMTKELCQLLGGNITVESTPGEGTTFRVQLPITNNAVKAEVTDLAPAPTADSEVPVDMTDSATDYSRPSVLIVEDSSDVMQYIAACLDTDYALSFAKDGQEGLEMALEKVPDLVLSDVMMPNMNGFDLCANLKTDIRTSHIPVILLTAKADMDSRLDGLQQGADVYLAKPFDERELKLSIENLLKVRQTLQARYENGYVAASDNDNPTMEDAFIGRIHDAVIEHLSEEKFSVTDLCNVMGMSRTQLHNKLKSLTGRSTTHYVRLIKLSEARQMIASRHDLNISQIAFQVGFSSLQYFSRVFSEEFGVSPSDYRKDAGSEQ